LVGGQGTPEGSLPFTPQKRERKQRWGVFLYPISSIWRISSSRLRAISASRSFSSPGLYENT